MQLSEHNFSTYLFAPQTYGFVKKKKKNEEVMQFLLYFQILSEFDWLLTITVIKNNFIFILFVQFSNNVKIENNSKKETRRKRQNLE